MMNRRATGRTTRRVVCAVGGACALLTSLAALGIEPPPASQPAGPQHAAIVTIKDEINDITLESLKRRIDQARQTGAALVVLEMDTPGGLASSALDICTYLKNITDLKTVAWINPSAYSAGSMIALSCNEIVMSSASKIGDCAPIIISPTEGLKELGGTERAKAESPILKEFRDSSHRRGYDPLLCEAMVRMGSEIWWLENGPGGERKFVLKRDKEQLMAEAGSNWRPVKTIHDPVSNTDIDLRQPIVEKRDLLTLTQTEALAYGFAKAIVSNERELRACYDIIGTIPRFTQNWAEGIADFLSSPFVRTILMMLIALGVYAEFQAPGHFVGAAVALVALLIFLGAPYLTGLADMWEVLLVLIGLILIAIELFVIPGFGIAGILGIILLLVGLIATFVPAEPGPIIIPRMPATWLGLKTGLQVVFGGLALAMVAAWFLNKYLPQIPGARGLFLPPAPPAVSTAAPGVGDAGLADAFAPPGETESIVHLGDVGIALTKLRPAGKAQINGRRVDVITQGQMLDEGCPLEIVEVSGSRIVVREKHQT
ncbi:MAG TPA: NfeD family protein [Phycisphaerae bacterium]|nr:NfeD family protein [Phycisphaerae bacterium]